MNPTHAKSVSSRRVLVTGATGALGSAVVAKFVASGDAVVGVHAPDHEPAAQKGVTWAGADLTQRNSVNEMFARAGEVDAVVHCAGGFRYAMADAISTEDLRFLIALIYESSYYVASAAIPALKKRGGGALLFISSLATQSGAPGMSAYSATKAAVNAMVVSLAAELKMSGVLVNAVMPSTIDTAANRKDMPQADPSKWVAPEEIAELLYDLSLPKSKSITGALIAIPGRV